MDSFFCFEFFCLILFLYSLDRREPRPKDKRETLNKSSKITGPRMEIIFDEYDMRKLPTRERLDKIIQILRNERDESIRWDSIWLAGEITEGIDKDDPLFAEIADLMVWVLLNDDNGIVKHEAAFQIGLRNMKAKIPYLINSALNDKKELVRHEAIEALGLMRAHGCKETLRNMLEDPSDAVRETAIFVLKRLDRLTNRGDYKGEAIL
jgi:HEAT repeat protein